MEEEYYTDHQHHPLPSKTTRKRKTCHEEVEEELCNKSLIINTFPLDNLNQDVLEKVLSWLPPSTFFRLSSVSKRWKSVSNSPSFKLACSSIPYRDPYFLMFNPNHDLGQSMTIFDFSEKHWKKLNHPINNSNPILPVASSGSLVCFRTLSGSFIVSNPITGSSLELPLLNLKPHNQSIHAIVMTTTTSSSNYKVVLVYGELPKLTFKVYNSCTRRWEEEIMLMRDGKVNELTNHDSNEDTGLYFLSKAGNVVVTSMERSPSKQYSSVIVKNKKGEEIIYFISSIGKIVACNLSTRSFSEYASLLPISSEYSIDVVECRGEMLVVVLYEFLESASVRVWRHDDEVEEEGGGGQRWQQVVAMPPWMCCQWYGKKVDINCVGFGDKILICMCCSSVEEVCSGSSSSSYFACDLVGNKWVELPKACFVDGESVEFMSAFAFEPRIEASV